MTSLWPECKVQVTQLLQARVRFDRLADIDPLLLSLFAAHASRLVFSQRLAALRSR